MSAAGVYAKIVNDVLVVVSSLQTSSWSWWLCLRVRSSRITSWHGIVHLICCTADRLFCQIQNCTSRDSYSSWYFSNV